MTQKPLLTFFQHLEELRRRILTALAALTAASLACFFYIDKILLILTGPIRSQLDQMYFFSPADAFVIKIKAALLTGCLISSPVILAQFWLFMSPGLHPKEKRMVLPLAFITSGFFIAGAVFSFVSVLPTTLEFLIGQQTEFLKPMVSMTEYISFVSGMMIAFGIAFNLPVFILALAATGFVRAESLNRYQRHAVVFIFITSAILTPGPDIASQLMLAVPLTVLFEISVLGAWLMELFRRKKKEARAS